MLKVVLIQERAILHTFPVQHIATNSIFSQNACSPLAELSSPNAIDAITHTDNRVEIIELECTIDIPVSLASNYRNFLGSCLLF